jgi:hypothetical protein
MPLCPVIRERGSGTAGPTGPLLAGMQRSRRSRCTQIRPDYKTVAWPFQVVSPAHSRAMLNKQYTRLQSGGRIYCDAAMRLAKASHRFPSSRPTFPTVSMPMSRQRRGHGSEDPCHAIRKSWHGAAMFGGTGLPRKDFSPLRSFPPSSGRAVRSAIRYPLFCRALCVGCWIDWPEYN